MGDAASTTTSAAADNGALIRSYCPSLQSMVDRDYEESVERSAADYE
jgi:hypothetical protein